MIVINLTPRRDGMSVPTFTAEKSLYKSMNSFAGRPGRSRELPLEQWRAA
jgi:hypothetical protein